MTRLMFTLILVLVPNWIAADENAGSPKPAPQPAGEPKRLSKDEALTVLRAHIKKEKPDAQLEFGFGAKELTTDAIWKNLEIQVFQIQGDVRRNEAFVIRGKRVFRIGSAFGGKGVISLCAVDLDGDGEFELVYSFAFGSGEHRSRVAVFNPLAKKPVERVCPISNFSSDDFTVKLIDEQTVNVLAAGTKVGVVVLEKEDDKLSAAIRLDDKLPAGLRAKLINRP